MSQLARLSPMCYGVAVVTTSTTPLVEDAIIFPTAAISVAPSPCFAGVCAAAGRALLLFCLPPPLSLHHGQADA